MSGDRRALYLLWLCAANDDDCDPAEMIEPPVPHGIAESVAYGGDFFSFFGLDPLLRVAAGSGLAPAPNPESSNQPITHWLDSLDNQRAKEVIHQMLMGDTAGEKARLLAEIRESQISDAWPTSDRRRSLAQLWQSTLALRAEEDAKQVRKAQSAAKREAAKVERQRAARMKEMVKDPDKWLREAERLVDARGTVNYKAAADILHDLREAVGGDEGSDIARRHAAHLAKKNPTLSQLKGSLRKRGLLEP